MEKTKIGSSLNFIDFDKVNALLEGFNKSTGFVTAILDLEGNILSKSGWRNICTEFHRVNPATKKNCIISDTVLANKMGKGKKYHAYKCLNGLMDVAVPLKIQGEHVANLFTGQFFFEKPDVAFYKKQAAEFGFDEIKYMDALNKVPVVSEEKVKVVMDFLLNMTLLISDLAFQKVEQENITKELRNNEQKFKSVFESANVGKSITLLSGEINVNKVFCEMLGYTPDELKNKKWQDLTPKEDIIATEKILKSLIAGEKNSARFEKKYVHKNGSNIIADVSVTILRDENGVPLYFITTIVDITERKLAEQALRESEAKFFTLFEKSPFSITLSKLPDGTFVAVNEAFEREFGITKENALGKNSKELGINPDDESRKRILESLKKGNSVRNQEMVLITKAGEKHYYETNIDKVVIDGEEYLLNTTQNIGEYKSALNKLEESYNLIKIAGEKAKLGGWNVNLNENRCYWSDEVAAIHEMPAGYHPLVEDGIKFYATEWREKITEVFSKCVKEGIPYDEEMEIITATGKRVWVRTIGEAVRNKEGNIFKIQGAFQDITLKKNSEQELKNSEAKYKAIFESTGTSTLIVDEDTTILMANDECFNMFGYEPASLIKQKWTKFVAPESLEEMIKNHELRRQNPELAPSKYEVTLLNSKGEKRTVVLSVKMIQGTAHSVVSMLDITARKEAEEELKKSKTNLEEYFENDISADYVVSVSGEIFSCNRTFLNLFGFEKKSETEKFDITKLYKNPANREHIIGEIKQNRKIENYEVEFISKDGKTIYALINAIGIFGEEDKLEKIRGYVVDITEQKNIEKELQRSEEKYRKFFEDDITGNYRTTLDGKILMCNEAFIKMLKYKNKEEVYGINTSELYFENKDRENFLNRLRVEKILQNSELTLKARDGSKVEIIENVIGVFDDLGELKEIIGYMFDITERKRAQFEYQTMIKTSSDGFWIVDAITGKLKDVNQAYCNMIGYSRDELLQMSVSDVEAVENQEETKEHIALIIEKGYDSFITKHVTKSGELIDIDASVTYIPFTEQFFVFIKDISDRKRIEKEILKLSHAIEQSPASIIVTDLEGNIEYVNPKLLEITGYSKEELIGKNPRLFNSGEKSKEEYNTLWETISSGREWFGEFHNKKKNGGLYWESASISPIFNEREEIINYVAVKEDITERKRLEDAQKLMLEISESSDKQVSLYSFLTDVHKKLKQIIRADNFYVALYNPKDNNYTFPYHVDEKDVVELNKPYDFSGGFTDHVLKSNKALIITPEYQLEIEKDGIVKGYGDDASVWLGVPFRFIKGKRPNGVIAIQDYKNLEPYNETDKSIMEILAYNIGHFIERIKYVEELVRAKEKAEEMNRVKSYFFANMSHELRTPFVGIMGYAELLNSEIKDENHKEMLNGILNTSKRMLSTLNNILNLTKIEFSGTELNIKPVRLQDILDTLLDEYLMHTKTKGLRFNIDNKNEKLIFNTDENIFREVLSNLLSNAVKFTNTGKIEIQSDIEIKEEEKFLLIKVIDTGIGIPEDKQSLIFDEFRQVSEGNARDFQGSGLGLAIVKKSIESLGGTIEVNSKIGSGSTFIIRIPL